jgi:transcription elongation factor/antiterminator RfaH
MVGVREAGRRGPLSTMERLEHYLIKTVPILGGDNVGGHIPANNTVEPEAVPGRTAALAGLPDTSSTGNGLERWYVVHTQPHAEDRTIANLARQSFATFCPRTRKTVRHARKTTHMLAPLFPNYVFVRLNVRRDRWRGVNGTRGVVRIISQGDTPIAVPNGVVEALKARMEAEDSVGCASSFKVGNAVRICEGPFSEFIGTIEQLDGAGRVRVLLELMGRAVSIVTRPNMVAPAA